MATCKNRAWQAAQSLLICNLQGRPRSPAGPTAHPRRYRPTGGPSRHHPNRMSFGDAPAHLPREAAGGVAPCRRPTPSSKATIESVRSFFTNSRPALRAAASGGRPQGRQRHDDHRGTGLTLATRVSRSSHGGRRGSVSGAVSGAGAGRRDTVSGVGWRSDSRTGPDWGSGW
jgi:hypothetical protein